MGIFLLLNFTILNFLMMKYDDICAAICRMTANCLLPRRKQVVTEGGLNEWVGRRRGRESRGWKLSKINTGGRNIIYLFLL